MLIDFKLQAAVGPTGIEHSQKEEGFLHGQGPGHRDWGLITNSRGLSCLGHNNSPLPLGGWLVSHQGHVNGESVLHIVRRVVSDPGTLFSRVSYSAAPKPTIKDGFERMF